MATCAFKFLLRIFKNKNNTYIYSNIKMKVALCGNYVKECFVSVLFFWGGERNLKIFLVLLIVEETLRCQAIGSNA